MKKTRTGLIVGLVIVVIIAGVLAYSRHSAPRRRPPLYRPRKWP